MIDFMHEGGWGMWATLLVFLAGVGLAVIRRNEDGAQWAIGGGIAVLASGLMGMSTGLYMTVANAAGNPETLGIGIRESVNNTVFAAFLALLLAALGVALSRRGGRLADAAKA